MSQMKMEMRHWEHHNRLQRVNKLNGLGVGWERRGVGGLFLLFALIDSCEEGTTNKRMRASGVAVPGAFGRWRQVGTELGTGPIAWVMQACR